MPSRRRAGARSCWSPISRCIFLGGGATDAKPRAGYEVGVIQMEVDEKGNGTGSVAAAARVKPGEDGVIVDDYGDQRIEITKVVREKP